ncbi:MAG: hypothetical protein KC413_05820 [Anaerolineales bacterium]|nr:hypothetical protein [Anaerolineales bacterium]
MQDEGKVLAQVYELILGREIMNALVGIGQHDNTLAVPIMGLALRARLEDMSTEKQSKKLIC